VQSRRPSRDSRVEFTLARAAVELALTRASERRSSCSPCPPASSTFSLHPPASSALRSTACVCLPHLLLGLHAAPRRIPHGERRIRATSTPRIFTRKGVFSQVPKDWDVSLGVVKDRFFFHFSQKNMDWEGLLGTLGDALAN